MVCRVFQFRDREFLKSLIFAKNEMEIYKLASLKQSRFSFQRKLGDLRTSKSLQSQKQQTISRRFPPPFSWLDIIRAKLNAIDAGRVKKMQEE